jgi:pimeloyl-ACP methyl ester carboxylesterase
VIHGREDPIPIEGAREVARLHGAQMVELVRCGHVPYIEAPEPLWAAARPFLDHAVGAASG